MFKWLRGILVFLTMQSVGADAEILNEEQFTQSFVAKLSEINPLAKAEINGRLEIIIRLSDDQISTAFLDNAYASYRLAPSALSSLLNDYAHNALDTAKGVNENLGAVILPVIRAYENFTSFSPDLLSESGKGLEHLPLTKDIAIFFVHDGAKSISYLNHEQFAKLRISKKQLFETSLTELDGGSHPTQIASAEVMAVVLGDIYTSSLIFSDNYLVKMSLKFKGDLVVFPIARDTFVVTGSKEEKGLEDAKKFARDVIAESPYPISAEPIVRLNGVWRGLN
jgi:uncharacterized protein YtpQ (UPF0354 family)